MRVVAENYEQTTHSIYISLVPQTIDSLIYAQTGIIYTSQENLYPRARVLGSGVGIRTLFGNFFGNNRCAYKKE